jgi:hypothetical protein
LEVRSGLIHLEQNGIAVAVSTPAPPRKAPDRRDFKVLLDEEYEVAMSNLPRAAWEPFSKIKAEMLDTLQYLAHRQDRQEDLGLVEPWPRVVQKTLQACDAIKAYLDQLVKVSPGVQALRSNQLVAAFRGADEWKTNQAKGIQVDPAQGGGEKRARRGVFSR